MRSCTDCCHIIVNDNPWLKARELATSLGYANTKQAIIKNVDEDDKQTYAQLLETTQVKRSLPETFCGEREKHYI